VMSLRELLAAPEGGKVSDIAWEEVQTVSITADREEVAKLVREYDLVAVPVVDRNGVIQGVVTVDDVIDALVEEHTEDVQRFGGMEALDMPYTQIGFFSMIGKRAPWLAALFLSEMLTTTAMGHFQGELEKAVVLALFVPLIISSGGNSGSQATSLIIRSLALGEIKLRDWWKIMLRELPSGLMLGLILGLMGIARILIWQQLGLAHYPHPNLLALTIGVALVGVVTFGSLAGSMLPFVLQRLGFDPASASAPFVSTRRSVGGASGDESVDSARPARTPTGERSALPRGGHPRRPTARKSQAAHRRLATRKVGAARRPPSRASNRKRIWRPSYQERRPQWGAVLSCRCS